MREFRSCSGAGGAPTWPAGVQGSTDSLRRLRHSRGRSLYRISAIGIDAEPDAPLPDGVLDLIATPANAIASPQAALK